MHPWPAPVRPRRLGGARWFVGIPIEHQHPESRAGQHHRGGQSGRSGSEYDDVAYGAGLLLRLGHGVSFIASPWSAGRLLTYQTSSCSLPGHGLLTSARPAVAELDRPEHLDQPVDGSGEVPTVGAERQVEHLRGRLLGGGARPRKCAPAPDGARRHHVHRPARRWSRAGPTRGRPPGRLSPAAPARWSAARSRPDRRSGSAVAGHSGRRRRSRLAPRERAASARPEADRFPRSAHGWPSSRRRPRQGTVADPSRTG